MKSLVIFDLDGTLLNTITDLGNASNYALRECGYPTHVMTSYPYFVGNGINKLLERALPDDARTEANIRKLREVFTHYYDVHKADNTAPYPGIPELLRELSARGVALAVASNKYQAAVEELVRQYFPDVEWCAVEGQKDDMPAKPDPSVVFGILSKHPTPKAEVLYVGDSGVDIETARRACVDSVGVTWGFRPVKELRDAHADYIVSKPAEIIPLLNAPLLP